MGFELRYRGERLGHFASSEAAESHAREHHGFGRDPGHKRSDHHVEDPESLTIEPARPVHLYCRGNLVDTYLTVEGAHAARAKLERPTRVEGGRIVEGDEAAWGIVDTRTEDVAQALAELYPAPPEPEPDHTQWVLNPSTGELEPREPSTKA